MPEISAILFDLDGTVTDSALDLSVSVNHMLMTLGFPRQPLEYIYGYIGRGVRNMLTEALGPHSDRIEEGLRIFREHYWDHCLDNTVLYPGVEEVIGYLNGRKLAIVTNKTQEFADKILKGLDIFDRFDAVLGGDNLPRLKPDPSAVITACEALAVEPETAIIVGDSVNDIISGREAGAMTCGVTYGLGKKTELIEAGARWIIDSMNELIGLIGRIEEID